MRVLQINVVSNWGSTGRIVEEIGAKLIENNDESYIAYSRGRAESKSHLIHVGCKFDILFHGVVTRLFDKHGLASRIATYRLIRYIQNLNPDIIHLHNIHGYYLNYPMLFSFIKKSHIPVVWTLHDCWAFTGHCSYFTYARCDKWKFQCFNCKQLRTYPKSLFLDNSKSNYCKKRTSFTNIDNLILVPVSNWLNGILDDSFLKNYPRKVIHNGINTDVFKPKATSVDLRNLLGITSDKFIVLGVTNIWDKRKGYDDFLKLRSLLDNDVLIILVGLSSDQINRLPQGIIGVSRTDSIDELVDYYNIADVFFNPTWEDNFPTTNIEALACGTPVITYKTGGSIEAVDERTGFIVKPGDLDLVVDIVNEMKQINKAIYKSVCRTRAVSLFNKDDRYLEYLNLYRIRLIHKI